MPQIGHYGTDLSGVESRAQRTALNLERRHIALLATTLGLWTKGDASTSDVVAWERSAGRGYPGLLAEVLWGLDSAVDAWATTLADAALADPSVDSPTLRRPKSPRAIIAALDVSAHGLGWPEAVFQALDEDGQGDFWYCLADAAISRAAITLKRGLYVVRVVLETTPIRRWRIFATYGGRRHLHGIAEFVAGADLAQKIEAQAPGWRKQLEFGGVLAQLAAEATFELEPAPAE